IWHIHKPAVLTIKLNAAQNRKLAPITHHDPTGGAESISRAIATIFCQRVSATNNYSSPISIKAAQSLQGLG
ncbi:MAG: hypothetical protein AAF722_07440, partial [Cyanobacteria bacterium P01_C01_bin.70]